MFLYQKLSRCDVSTSHTDACGNLVMLVQSDYTNTLICTGGLSQCYLSLLILWLLPSTLTDTHSEAGSFAVQQRWSERWIRGNFLCREGSPVEARCGYCRMLDWKGEEQEADHGEREAPVPHDPSDPCDKRGGIEIGAAWRGRFKAWCRSVSHPPCWSFTLFLHLPQAIIVILR